MKVYTDYLETAHVGLGYSWGERSYVEVVQENEVTHKRPGDVMDTLETHYRFTIHSL